VALIAGGHSRQNSRRRRATLAAGAGRRPSIEQTGSWEARYTEGLGADEISSGIEVIWNTTPNQVEQTLFDTRSASRGAGPRAQAGAHQWTPKTARRRFGYPTRLRKSRSVISPSS